MAVLTVTPSRFGLNFEIGSYLYVFADRPVRKLGALVTPEPITLEATAVGSMAVELVPNSEVDEAEDFTYTISAFDPDGQAIFTFNIVMPDTDITIFDLIPVEQDLNTCVTKTLETNA